MFATADVYAVLFILIGILVSVPGLLVALNLLFPRVAGRAEARLRQTPGRSFIVGLPVLLFFIFWFAVTAEAGGAVTATGFVALGAGMAIGSIGGAGMARLLGGQLGRLSGDDSDVKNLVRGAVVYELACLVPLAGWFIFLPLVAVTAMGAGVFALLGWGPRKRAVEAERGPVAATIAQDATQIILH